MKLISILIPLVFGILLLAFPRLFTKSVGPSFDAAKAKFRKIGFLLLAVAGLYSAVKIGESYSQGVAGKPEMEMHRTQATTPRDSGWYLAESTHGSFSVLLPIPFNDFTVTASDPKSGPTKTYTVGARSAEGMKFSATEMPFVPGTTPPDLDQMPQALSKDGQQVSDVIKAPFSGCPSISFSVDGPNSGACVRYVRTRSSLIAVILEYPATRRSEAALLKTRFLDSLKIKTPNPAASGNGAVTPWSNGGLSWRAVPEQHRDG